MQVEKIATQLFYCAFMVMFVGSFLEVVKFPIKFKRIVKYIAAGAVYIPLVSHLPLGKFRFSVMFPLVIFFIFEGTFLERTTISTIAESVWCALQILCGVIFGDTLEIVVVSDTSRQVLLDLICLVILSCIVRIINQTSLFEQDIAKKRVASVRQLLGMLVLAIEGDLVLGIAMFVEAYNIEFPYFPTALITFVLGIAGLYLVCFALSLDNAMAKEYYKVVNKTLESQIKSQYSYYKKLDKVNRETRAIKHDMKNHLIVMKGMIDKGDLDGVSSYVSNIQTKMDNVSVVIHTGNSIVDSIVNEKREIALSKKIELNINVALPEEVKVEPMDLCVMVANSLDNAIEACAKIPSNKKRDISFYGRCEHGYLSFIISNSVNKNIRIEQNLVVTDKEDKLNHGYGLTNIGNSVRRSNGKLNIECKDQRFSLYIDIPMNG
ncbi:sensor histidine kinase [[Clostridium] polysaccharolyticum]|uniref:GHKL domain-containing protein n=1 Tax=[Clostridium] polysaccharolyticum TaxID=29364 RepID=A0A1I0E7A7_9FIRM|nr:sensor histidine kinase [[Clostridium] polysaccharolyticum]SET41080.1 GHKL domain-containing protein [[Clostridium] polysaccharolyticum]